jgi:tRNA threonylcarbamoyl adenosine modification protein (Sua5/YciO/YrdC/YwlC family)
MADTRILHLHPDNPQSRLLRQAAQVIAEGGVIAAPTDASTALLWRLGEREPLERVRRLRGLDDRHLMTLICRDLSQLSLYAAITTRQFRFLKEWAPGPYTFVLPASREVPKRLLHPSRRTLGLRVPDSVLLRGLLDALGEPLLGTTLQLPGDELPLADSEQIADRLAGRIELILACGPGGTEPTTVIDLTGEDPVVTRIGRGSVEAMLGRRA